MGQRIFLQDPQFPLRLQELRKSKGLTQAALSDKTAGLVSRNWVLNAESGRFRNVEMLLLQKVADVLEVSMDYLVSGRNYSSRHQDDLTFVVSIDVSLTGDEEEMIRRTVDQLVRNLVEYMRKHR